MVVEVGGHMQCLDKGIYGGEGKAETVAVFVHQRLFIIMGSWLVPVLV